MDFAGEYAYISKNKIKKVQEIVQTGNSQPLVEEEKKFEPSKDPKVVAKKRERKRSVSIEKICEDDLDNNYSCNSCEEDDEEESASIQKSSKRKDSRDRRKSRSRSRSLSRGSFGNSP